MSRLFGFAVGALWLVFALMAFSRSSAGWSAGHADIGFWWGFIAFLLAVASTVAFVGTLRHRTSGPRK